MRILMVFFILLFLQAKTTWGFTKPDSLRIELITALRIQDKHRLNMELSRYYQNHEIDSALIYAFEAYELSKQIDNEEQIGSGINLGSMFFNKGSYQRALEYFLDVLPKVDSIENVDQYFGLLFNIGLVFQATENLESAREYYQKAIDVFKWAQRDSLNIKQFYLKMIGRAYVNVGILDSKKGLYEKAFAYYDTAEVLSKQLNSEEVLTYIYNNRGRIYQSQKLYDSALVNYKWVLHQRQKQNNPRGIGVSYFYIGDTYREMAMYDSSLNNLLKALEFTENTGNLKFKSEVLYALIGSYKSIGKAEKAIDYLAELKEVNDSINLAEIASSTAALEMQYSFDKYISQQKFAREKVKTRNLIVFISLSLVLVILVLLYILTRIKAKQVESEKKQVEQEKEYLAQNLDMKNKELATNIMHLVSKNELIIYVSEELMKNRTKFKKMNLDFIQDIVVKLNQNANANIWQEFEMRFNEINESFYKVLSERFPNLSTNERRLCAFLKLNMSTKEISAITQQNTHTINIARSRLRKKLGLENSEIGLNDFLIGLG